MNRLVAAALAAVVSLGATAAAADIYLRKGDQEISVVKKDGALLCTRVSDGYEMCNGMTQSADGAWRGKKMKHPDMPGFMRFNGTVTFAATSLTIEGCALGMCDSEVWQKKK